MSVSSPQPAATDEGDATARALIPRRWTSGDWLALAVVVLGFLGTLPWQWNSIHAIAMADGIAYLTGGVNLVTTGSFTNPYGEPETWFPPFYPLLIGIFSLGERIDPVMTARLICALFATVGVVCVYLAVWWGTSGCRAAALLAGIALAANPMYQSYALAVMSHAPATALVLAAFVFWLRLPSVAPAGRLVLLGALIALSYLSRPEGILLLPLWGLIDIASQGWREGLRRALWTGTTCALIAAPYVVYLHQHTGRWQLSGKGDVTVAIGRGIFYGAHREGIDSTTLEWKYGTFEVTPEQELHRYWFNARQIYAAFVRAFRSCWGGGILLAAALGAVRLLRQRKYRFAFGLLAQLSFLAALIPTWCEDRMLHAAMPVIAMFAGVGLAWMLSLAASHWRILRQDAVRQAESDAVSATEQDAAQRGRVVSLLLVVLLLWTAVGLLESGTRMPRWSWADGIGPKTLLRDAGQAFREKHRGEPQGAMYEIGASIGYYAGQLRRQIPSGADLSTLVRYAQRRDGDARPIYFALWTGEAHFYHPTLREPFLADRLPYPKVLEVSAGGQRVAIYRIPQRAAN